MARNKPYDLNQTKMIPLSYADQIVGGNSPGRASRASERPSANVAFLSQNQERTEFWWKVSHGCKARLALVTRVGFSTASLGGLRKDDGMAEQTGRRR